MSEVAEDMERFVADVHEKHLNLLGVPSFCNGSGKIRGNGTGTAIRTVVVDETSVH